MKPVILAALVWLLLVAASPAPSSLSLDAGGDDLDDAPITGPGAPDPVDRQDCRDHWEALQFRSLGQCIKLVKRGYP